jgi:hypothetical protein
MKVRFLYSQDCPSHEEALRRLRSVLDEEGVREDLEIVQVNTFEEAQREHFIGSPTIFVDGVDISPTSITQYAPACRAYVLEDGRISPLPSEAMIRKGVRTAKENLKSAHQQR